MIVYRTKDELIRHLDSLRGKGKSIGLVPTMGALHQGHISLVTRSISDNDCTVVSIFVNPTQFNDPSDLERYPRTPEKDLELLQENGVDLVFMPPVKEMYPEADQRHFDLEGLDRVMEGATREGHFNGVAQIVSKLFQSINPHRAYFGQKDFQQLVIIRHLAKLMKLETEIIACPIIREQDGLAMSSRNNHLGRKERKEAPFIYQTLVKATEMKGGFSPNELRSWVESRFDQHPLMKLDYFVIVEDKALKPLDCWEEGVNKVGCVAVILGGIRLIDNMFFN
ncbi:MAG: pantoate--beta-alanine ligase [Bacteroidetes bacterium]|nr:pantoate--beta-alanine ligase [Bacteroidota bacterium]